jgi:hypothetical protein
LNKIKVENLKNALKEKEKGNILTFFKSYKKIEKKRKNKEIEKSKA